MFSSSNQMLFFNVTDFKGVCMFCSVSVTSCIIVAYVQGQAFLSDYPKVSFCHFDGCICASLSQTQICKSLQYTQVNTNNCKILSKLHPHSFGSEYVPTKENNES